MHHGTISASAAALAFVFTATALPAIPAHAQDAAATNPATAPDLSLWRLDCGTLELSDTGPFSDAHLYDGETRTLTDSCYLIRHGEQYLLWDTGLPAALKGNSVTEYVFTLTLDTTIAEQLAKIDLIPDDIDLLAVSHYHDDHLGQAAQFADATLLMNSRDFAAVSEGQNEAAAAALAPWIGEDAGETRLFAGDLDVFGDGSVVVKAMPGHTPGHSALLVRLPETGAVLLTGDLYHFEEQISNRGVPSFNTDRADTLASFERFNQIAKSLDARIVIQHDPRHIERLPAFPEAAR